MSAETNACDHVMFHCVTHDLMNLTWGPGVAYPNLVPGSKRGSVLTFQIASTMQLKPLWIPVVPRMFSLSNALPFLHSWVRFSCRR